MKIDNIISFKLAQEVDPYKVAVQVAEIIGLPVNEIPEKGEIDNRERFFKRKSVDYEFDGNFGSTSFNITIDNAFNVFYYRFYICVPILSTNILQSLSKNVLDNCITMSYSPDSESDPKGIELIENYIKDRLDYICATKSVKNRSIRNMIKSFMFGFTGFSFVYPSIDSQFYKNFRSNAFRTTEKVGWLTIDYPFKSFDGILNLGLYESRVLASGSLYVRYSKEAGYDNEDSINLEHLEGAKKMIDYLTECFLNQDESYYQKGLDGLKIFLASVE